MGGSGRGMATPPGIARRERETGMGNGAPGMGNNVRGVGNIAPGMGNTPSGGGITQREWEIPGGRGNNAKGMGNIPVGGGGEKPFQTGNDTHRLGNNP